MTRGSLQRWGILPEKAGSQAEIVLDQLLQPPAPPQDHVTSFSPTPQTLGCRIILLPCGCMVACFYILFGDVLLWLLFGEWNGQMLPIWGCGSGGEVAAEILWWDPMGNVLAAHKVGFVLILKSPHLWWFSHQNRQTGQTDRPGAPNLWGLMPDDLRWSWCNNNRNRMHNKCSVCESSWNHPHPPGLWENCLLLNLCLMPKRLRTTVMNCPQHHAEGWGNLGKTEAKEYRWSA